MTRYFLTVLFAYIALLSTNAADLGLAERRAIKTFQENKLAELLKPIVASVGEELELHIDWDKIAVPGEAVRYNTEGYWINIFFVPVTKAMQSLTLDDLGKKAVEQKVKKSSSPTMKRPHQ